MKAMTLFLHKIRRFLRSLVGNQDGAIAVIFAVCLASVVGMLALALDLARAYNLDTELQHAADAAALSGATQLDGETNAINRACLAATGDAACTTLNVAATLVANTQTFANDALGRDVAGFNIQFLVNLDKDVNGIFLNPTTVDADADFIEVCVTPRSVDLWFAGIVGAVTQASADACAVAGMGAAYCQVPPMFMCWPNPPPNVGDGIWMKGKGPGNSSSWFDGNYGLLRLPGANPPSSLIREAMAKVTPPNQCFSAGGNAETKTGETTSISAGMNVRFDIYKSPMNGAGVQDNWNYQPAQNTVKGLLPPTGGKCDISNNGWRVPAVPFTPAQAASDPTAIEAMSYPYDDCAYTVADGGTGTCMPGAIGGRIGDGNWDIVTYMTINHPSFWPQNMLGYGAAMDGLDFMDGNVSRFEVYLWELANELSQNVNEEPTPTCFNDPGYPLAPPYTTNPAWQPEQDRRTICVAAIDCTGLGGGTQTINPTTWVRLFILEPVGIGGDNKSIYAELIDPAGCIGPDTNIARNVVQLYE